MTLAAEVRYDDEGGGPACLRYPGWYQRLYASLLSRENVLYDAVVASRTQDLFGEIAGTVLELGPGPG